MIQAVVVSFRQLVVTLLSHEQISRSWTKEVLLCTDQSSLEQASDPELTTGHSFESFLDPIRPDPLCR